MEDKVYVAWQDEVSRRWETIACLTKRGDEYELIFTKGAEKLDNISKKLFRLEPGNRYVFSDLIAIFKNKIPSKSRPDFHKMARWLGADPDAGEFGLLKAFGLIPSSDSTLAYPGPTIEHGQYRLQFFIHGIRHMHPDAIKQSEGVATGERLLPMLDVQNPTDPNAVALRTTAGLMPIGYVPAFYAADLRKLLAEPAFASQSRITVTRNNHDSPIQFRLLCSFVSPLPREFRSFDTDSHKPMLRAGELL